MSMERKKLGETSLWIVLLVFCIGLSVFCTIRDHSLIQSKETVRNEGTEEMLENLEIRDSYSIQNENEDRKDIPDLPSGI